MIGVCDVCMQSYVISAKVMLIEDGGCRENGGWGGLKQQLGNMSEQ